MRTAVILLALLASSPAYAKDSKPFDPSADPAAQAAGFLKASKLTALAGTKRIAISEFRVEFAVENSGKASSSSSAGWTSSSSKITLVGVSDEMRQAITDHLYDQLVQKLTEAGLEVVPHETVDADASYRSMEKVFRTGQEPVGMQAGKSIFVGAHGTPYYLTNDDKHIGLGTALGGFSTVQPQNIEPRMAETLDATVLRVTMAVKFADIKASGGMFHMGSSVKTSEGLAWVPDQTQFLFVTPDSGRARVVLNRTAVIAGDAITIRDVTTKGEKVTQAVANVMTGLLAGGGRTSREYEATANPDAYVNSVTEYGVALESALVAMVQPAVASQAKD